MLDEGEAPALAPSEPEEKENGLPEEGGRLDLEDARTDAFRLQELARKREESKKRKQAEEEQAWADFLVSERREIVLRRRGQLAQLLGEPLPGELPATLKKLAAIDQLQAERGLVALMSGGTTTYKPLEDLRREDMPARIAANRLRVSWLKERRDEWRGRGETAP